MANERLDRADRKLLKEACQGALELLSHRIDDRTFRSGGPKELSATVVGTSGRRYQLKSVVRNPSELMTTVTSGAEIGTVTQGFRRAYWVGVSLTKKQQRRLAQFVDDFDEALCQKAGEALVATYKAHLDTKQTQSDLRSRSRSQVVERVLSK